MESESEFRKDRSQESEFKDLERSEWNILPPTPEAWLQHTHES